MSKPSQTIADLLFRENCSFKVIPIKKPLPKKQLLSGGLDSNQRPPAPHADTLPGCATTRTEIML